MDGKAYTQGEKGYTAVDFLATVAVLFLLGILTWPLLAASRTDVDATLCLANKRQLMRAWQAYTDDHNQAMPGVGTNPLEPSPTLPPPYWAHGWLDWTTASANTNTLYLTSARYAQLAPYAASNRFIFKCPADVYTSTQQKNRGWRERVRSVSANMAVGEGNAEAGPWNTKYFHVKKTSDFRTPGPANVFVFLDEHPDSLNDTGFFSPTGVPGALQMVDLPATYHNGAAGFGFADGRAEMHRWVSSLRGVKVTTTVFAPPSNNQMQVDLRYLYEHTPQR